MYDLHYDLLTAMYMAKLNNNFKNIKEWIECYNKDNVIGLVATMCFMSKEEMDREYHIDYYKDSNNIIDMFENSISLTKKYMPEYIDVLYGIEGCDFLKDISDLEILYDLGVRVVNIVWNEANKYASGNRDTYGLTDLGKKLIKKIIDLNMIIDLSHANSKTFDDIIELVKEEQNKGKKVHIYASHSNSKKLCDINRNLTDEQIKKIKEVDGYIGVCSNRNFVIKNAVKNNVSDIDLRESYIEHIKYIGNIIGFDKVLLSTDDMTFSNGDEDYKKLPIYNYRYSKEELYEDLIKNFDKKTTNDIMYMNARSLFEKVK